MVRGLGLARDAGRCGVRSAGCGVRVRGKGTRAGGEIAGRRAVLVMWSRCDGDAMAARWVEMGADRDPSVRSEGRTKVMV